MKGRERFFFFFVGQQSEARSVSPLSLSLIRASNDAHAPMPALAGRPAGRAPTHRPGHHRAGRPARPLRATPLHDDEASAPPNPPPPPLILHFAYGANMDPAVLGRRGLTGPAWATPAVARGWRLAFNHRAAYANLEEGGSPAEAREGLASHPPDTTPPPPPPPPPPPWPADPHGVLYGLAPADWAALVAAEGGYGVRQVEVVTYGGEGGAGGGGKKEGMDQTSRRSLRRGNDVEGPHE